ncbi:hypothetical protein MKK68_25915 [Methylobacterium sp. E-016]|uniref:hypothetical protein n=1 Tax=Methylobacterium sp. E-016 TaxID=2836556 RepID=UPI001FB87252|nr:hypothetical protein [Methylobacterium sp. E-016]MCJ2079029.1 hypothetical protein [Methylobacterium sp. E-016]
MMVLKSGEGVFSVSAVLGLCIPVHAVEDGEQVVSCVDDGLYHRLYQIAGCSLRERRRCYEHGPVEQRTGCLLLHRLQDDGI